MLFRNNVSFESVSSEGEEHVAGDDDMMAIEVVKTTIRKSTNGDFSFKEIVRSVAYRPRIRHVQFTQELFVHAPDVHIELFLP
jgi:hypothetical protein